MAVYWDGAAVERQIEDWARGVALEVAEAVAEEAQRRAPVLTGRLRASVGVEVARLGSTYRVIASAPHAQYVHEGTRFMRARPFLADAAEAVARQGLVRIMGGKGR